MTTIVERRRETDFIAAFLIIVFALATWRGATGAPVLAGLFGLGAVGVLLVWIAMRRQPAPILTISPDEIFYGRIDQRGIIITRNASGRLRFLQGSGGNPWLLVLVDDPDALAISMLGFDMREVARACEKHGWTFGVDAVTTSTS